MNDKQLRRSVIDELDFEPGIESAGIGVNVGSGVVTLTGHVSAYAQKLAAERTVGRVKGLMAIAQDLQVRIAGDTQQSDGDIAHRAINILAWTTWDERQALKCMRSARPCFAQQPTVSLDPGTRQ